MSLWLFIFLPLIAVGAPSPPKIPANHTDLRAAMVDMRSKSYHGFVILLKILIDQPNTLRDRDITFLVPDDVHLSKAAVTMEQLDDFILSYSIPTPLLLSTLLHFPPGTLVPSSHPNRMINVTNNGRTGVFVNNARIIYPNMCVRSSIKCHGINDTITFDDTSNATSPAVAALPANLHAPAVVDSPNKYNRARSSSSIDLKRDPLLH